MTELFEIMKQRCEGMLLVSQAVDTCAEVMADAFTPRPPQPEWFGTGPWQWDTWWICRAGMADAQVHRLCTTAVAIQPGSASPTYLRVDGRWHFEWGDINCVLPVARKGYPAPVGWQVVGGL